MPDSSDAAAVASSQPWINRIALLSVNAAVDILAESEEAPHHELRADLARAVIRSDPLVMMALPRLVMSNEVVRSAAVADAQNYGSAVADSDLEYVISSLWNSMAKSLLRT